MLDNFELVLLLCAVVFVGFWAYRSISIKIRLGFIEDELEESKNKLEELEKIHISNIKSIQILESENKHLKEELQNSDAAYKEAFSAAKASLFELGGTLSKQLIDLHKQENKESRELSEKRITDNAQKFHEEFERIVKMVASLNQEVDNSKSTVDIIKQSLLSPSGAGQLAEITLENVLKSSGLKPGVDFIMQYNVNLSEDKKIRPDAVVFLPGNNMMVIDAKASKFLVDFTGDENKSDNDNLLRAMNSHIKSLSSKEYRENIITSFNLQQKHVNHVMMLMFLPTEYAVDKISNMDKDFSNKAWGVNIFPVGPAGLMNMLSFARFQIHDNIRTINHNVILEEIRKIISSISMLTEYSQKIGNSVQSLVNNYDKFSASFNRNFLPKVRAIGKLGIESTNKEPIKSLTRYHLVSSKSELIDVDSLPLEEDLE
ncbi:MAG: hypothetical protein RLZZ59_84 [Pseudomonadota bacterium]|jgi:DNA recombination protein RmuC